MSLKRYVVVLQRFLTCRTEEFDFDMDGEKEPICFKEISTALRQWILPAFVSLLFMMMMMMMLKHNTTSLPPCRRRG